jgi:endo-1,3(4)-beta-glucanase
MPTFSSSFVSFSLIIQTGFYSDHHFHYGYHIYAAAAVAHFDRDWGRVHFEDVLLLIRDIANPSSDDNFFPRFRHKDWYQGSSWASGVLLPTFTNGMNQESSSEAIAAYEAVALFGQEMVSCSDRLNTDMSCLVGSHL